MGSIEKVGPDVQQHQSDPQLGGTEGGITLPAPTFQLQAGPNFSSQPIQRDPSKDTTPEVIVVGYTGGVTGEGTEMEGWREAQNVSTSAVNDAVAAADEAGIQTRATVISPGFNSATAVATGTQFVQNRYTAGMDKVIIYGYSRGGDCAVELATALDALDIPVELLITVDAAFGWAGPAVVDREIPDNVRRNINQYQTNHSRIGSRGDSNTAADAGATTINNHDMSAVEGITHGNIHQAARGYNAGHMMAAMGMDVDTDELEFGSPNSQAGSSANSSASSSDSAGDNSSSGSFNDRDSSSGSSNEGGSSY